MIGGKINSITNGRRSSERNLGKLEGTEMGISYEIAAEEGIIYTIAEGNIRLEEIQAFRKILLADPKFRPGLGEIVEYRLAKISISDEDAKTLASTIPTELARKVALVAIGPEKKFFLRFKEMVKDMPVEVFTDLASAKKWVTSD